MRNTVGNFLFNLSGWLLLIVMVAAVWRRGSVMPSDIDIMLWILAGAVACWGTSLWLQRRIPPFTAVTIAGGILLLQGWVMYMNPASKYDGTSHIFSTVDFEYLLPHSVDAYSTYLGMLSFTVLFCVFHVAIDCWRNESFRQQVMWTAAISTAAVALLGTLQKIILFLQESGHGSFFPPSLIPQNISEFGPFDYHANAAALMLACLPMAASLAVGAWVLRRKGIATIATVLTLLIAIGIFANTARSAVALSIFLMIGLALGYWVIIGGVLPGTWFARFMTIAGILVVAVAGIVISAIVMPNKWHAVVDQLNLQNPRILQWKIVLAMSGDAGIFGFGPNTFAIEFPVTGHFDPALYNKYVLTYHMPGEQMSIWSHAHSDPLQALIEYGWFGFCLWVAMGVMTVVAAVKQMYIPAPIQVKFSLLAAFAGWLAVMVYSMFDFPLQVLSLQVYVVIFAGMIWAERLTELQRIQDDKAFGYQVMLGR